LDYRKLFNESYIRTVLNDQDDFFVDFYKRFTNSHKDISKIFANTNVDRQVSMLQESLLYMIDFANSDVASPRIHRLATLHGASNMNIPARIFELWIDCLVEAVRERDPQFTPEIETAWRVKLAPGLAFFKAHCKR